MPIIAMLFLLSGCDDQIEIEEQDPVIVDSNNQPINVTEVLENETAEDVVKNVERDDIFKQKGSPDKTFPVYLDEINDTSASVQKTLALFDMMDIYLQESVVKKITLTKVTMSNIYLSIDGRQAQVYEEGDSIEVSDGYHMRIDDVLYNEEGERYLSMVEFTFYMKKERRYPEYLVERDIGLHQYIRSEKRGDDYEAVYLDAKVTVEMGERFTARHSNDNHVIEYLDASLYKFPDKEGVTWLSLRGDEEYIITVNRNAESLIRKYLERYPSFITARTFCEKEFLIDEQEEKTVEFQGKELVVNAAAILDSTLDVKLIINNKISERLGTKEATSIEGVTFIIDEVDLNYDGNTDRVKICLV